MSTAGHTADSPGNPGASEWVLLTRGPSFVRIGMTDCNWALYTYTGGASKSPDKSGKDIPSLPAFFSNYGAMTTGQSK